MIAVPLPRQDGGWRLMAFAEARECGRDGGQTCDPGLAPDGAPKGLAFRYSDWGPNATTTTGWTPALGTAPTMLYRDGNGSCCLNLGAVVYDAVKDVVHLHFVVGLHSKSGEQVLLSSRDYGATWQKSQTYGKQLETAGLYIDGAPAFAPGPGLGVQLMAPTKARHRMLVCGQGKGRMSSVCIASDDHAASWVSAGAAAIDDSSMLPSEATLVELRNGSVLMNSRNSCHRLPAPHTCCWGDGCYDKQGVPHCHGPKTCDHTHDNKHARLLMWSDDGGETFGAPQWCSSLPDPDCEGSMVSDVDSGDLLFANNRNGTIGNRDNMTVYHAVSDGSCSDWSLLHRVNSGPAGYSCLASMPGRRLGILYEHAWSTEAVAVNDRDRTNIVFELLQS